MEIKSQLKTPAFQRIEPTEELLAEIDAASKTSVDDVRELIEFSRYKPTSAKYKIFICDEDNVWALMLLRGRVATFCKIIPHAFALGPTNLLTFN